MTAESAAPSTRRHRPKATTVFVAAFLAGAVAAVVVNRMLDLHLAQAKPQVESEPIFVALRPLPQGSPVTVWDVALRDWPRAMLPSTALKASDSFEGSVLKYPLREGQPLLSVHLLPTTAATAAAAATEEVFVKPQAAPPTPSRREPEPDLWTPGGTAAKPAPSAPQAARVEPARETMSFAVVPLEEPAAEEQPVAEPAADTVAETLPEAEAEPVTESTAAAAVAADTSLAEIEEVAAEPVPADSVAVAEEADDAIMDEPLPAAEPVPPAPAGVPTLVAVEPPAEEPPVPADEPAEVAGPAVSEPAPPVAAITRRDSDLPLLGRLAPDPDATIDAAPPAVDLDSMPSVLAGSGMDSDPEDTPTAVGNPRYLVVPERIARQADTMFAPPVAAEPQAAAEPKAVAQPKAVPEPKPLAQPKTAAKPIEQPRPQAQPQASQNRPRNNRRPPIDVRPQQPVPAVKDAPRSAGQPAQPSPPSREDDRNRTALGPRAWGGMFPNVAAGVEAFGNRWRGDERSAAQPRPAPQQR
jgi:hypothetical protein